MTLEEAQARIVELTDENETLKTEKQTLSENNETLSKDLKNARDLNQKLMLRVTHDEPNDDGNDAPVPTCEDFAKTLKI